MTKERISIARALIKLKLYDKQIEGAIEEFKSLHIKIGKQFSYNSMNEEKFISSVTSSLQRFDQLIKNRKRLKSGIVLSNSSTKVKINDIEMSIADVIDYKSFIEVEKKFLKKLKMELYTNKENIEILNNKAQTKLDSIIEVQHSKDKSKHSGEEYNSTVKTFWDNNQAKLVDPLNIEQLLKDYQNEIDNFESEVNITLTESNTQTYIEVEL